MQAINECLTRTMDETLLSDLLNNALNIAGGLEGKVNIFLQIVYLPQFTFNTSVIYGWKHFLPSFLNLPLCGLIISRSLLFKYSIYEWNVHKT